MITLYGIPNCDTVRKSRKWFEAQGIEVVFHDFRKDGLDPALVAGWLGSPTADKVINTRGPSWRKLSDDEKVTAKGDDHGAAAAILSANPTVIKRPVVVAEGKDPVVGYDEAAWSAL